MTKRTRSENRAAHTAEVHCLTVSEAVRIFLSWFIGALPGLNKDGSRYVARIIDEFDLENFNGVARVEDRSKEYDYELSGYEIQFLLDKLSEMFNGAKIPPAYAKAALGLDGILNDALEGPPEGPIAKE